MHYLLGVMVLLGSLCSAPAWAAEEQIVQQLSANGSRNTRPFIVQDRWEVQWKADKDLSVYLLDANGDLKDSIGSSKGAGTGSTYQAKGGTFSLKIIGSGNWTITVVQLP
jgi:hypothetical protein